MKKLADKIKAWLKKVRDWLIEKLGGHTDAEFRSLKRKNDSLEKSIVQERSHVHSFKASANTLLLSYADRKSIPKCIEVFKKQIFEDLGEQMSRYISVDIVNNEFVARVYVYDMFRANALANYEEKNP